MSDDTLLITSPLFFVHPRRRGVRAIDVTRNERYSALKPLVFELITFFIEPRTVGSAINSGFSREVVEEGLKAGILMPYESSLAEDALRWENHRWSRSAYLTFSQLDLDYVEPTEDFKELQGLSDFRRTAISNYLQERPYPDILLKVSDSPIDLPPSELNAAPDLDSMLRRRSLRFFSDHHIALDTFSSILFEATKNVRLAHESKNSGDPYYLLNSFYSWLNVYLAVQGVERVARGVYQYDPLKHQLHLVAEGLEDEQIVECIQYQKWINGAGFCLFVVVQWERYMWIYRHSRAYLNLLIQLGEFGQEVLQAMCRRGLGAWMTPAVTESKAAALLQLDPMRQEAMYFIKVGPPPQK
jgi:SagB-type dehydrogenase family enzyme